MRRGAIIDGRYEVVGPVGAGASATVYRVRDRHRGGLPAALKLLRGVLTEDVARLRGEATILTRLDHPHLVRALAHGVSSEGTHYLALEWLEGEDLRGRIRRGALDAGEALALARGAARALACVHAAGIVHRDVKPGNLMLPDGEPARVKLLDFGIAMTRHRDGPPTETGVVMGTPGYMPPEQARRAPDIGPAADVFALGAVLFEALTGRRPFAAHAPLAEIFRTVNERAPRLSTCRGDVPAALDALVARMLDPDPAVRPADGASLLAALDALHVPSTQPLEPVRGPVLTGPVSRHGTVAVAALAAHHVDEDARAWRDEAPQAIRLERLDARTALLWAADVGCALDEAEIVTRGARIAARSGATAAVATGACLRDARLPLGDAVSTAFGLLERGALEPGGVLVDAAAAHLLRGRARLQRFGAGDDPRERRPWRFDGFVADRFGPPEPWPLVGRAHEVAALVDACRASVRDGARAALLIGPSGRGKTRLARALAEQVALLPGRGRPRLHTLRAGPERGTRPMALIGRWIRAWFGLRDEEPPEEHRRRVLEALRAAGVSGRAQVSDALLRVARCGGVAGPDDRAWLLSWLRAEAARRPIVLIVDDLHRADRATLGFLDDMLRELAELPLLVVGTARPAIEVVAPGLWSRRALDVLRLRPLPASAAVALAGLLGAASPDAVAVESGGEPAAVVALARGTPSAKTALDARLQARVAHLDEPTARVLRAVALCEAPVELSGVERLLGGRGDVSRLLSQLLDREILRRRGLGGGPIEFRLPALADAVRRSVCDADRARAQAELRDDTVRTPVPTPPPEVHGPLAEVGSAR